LFSLSKGADDATSLGLSLATICQPNFLHSILFSITCPSITGGIMINRRQLWCGNHHYHGCQLHAKHASM